MSNYRRLISYIYAYEGGIKGKNIGFAKIETRGSQCKITVNVKKVYVGGNDIGVYLLAGEKEIWLGNIFIRGGSGEFRTAVSSGDVEHSGIPVDQCYGLTVHDVENTWRSYTTIWEDAVAHAAEVELSNILPENEENVQEARIKKAIQEIEEEFPVEEAPEISEPVSEPISESVSEPVKPERSPAGEPPEDSYRQEEPAENSNPPVREPYRPQQEPVKMAFTDGEPDTYTAQGAWKKEVNAPGHTGFSGIPAVEYAAELTPDIETVPGETVCYRADTVSLCGREEKDGTDQQAPETQKAQEVQPAPETQKAQEVQQAPETQKAQEVQPAPKIHKAQEVQPAPGDPEKLERLIETEEEENTSEQLWEQLRRKHTKILDFDYEKGCEILTIKPQDIGLLPREVWMYGNNSFLLHGYYNYRYLILAKLFNPEGAPRYLLGVPGHYYSNERYMASMFGFPNFVLSKNQPMEDGRFGYWYTDIKIGD